MQAASDPVSAGVADSAQQQAVDRAIKVTPYSYYVLVVILIVGLLNHIDRVIVSILAEKIRIAMHLSDAQLGFLYGTAFAVFFAVVGIPMGRMADAVTRKNLMAGGLAFWSAMTACCGLAANFPQLAASRLGVGFGEATATPSSYSLLADYFPTRSRATVFATYLCGTAAGGGCALLIGGYMVQHWSSVCTSWPIPGACHVPGWQAAFFVAGVPGMLMAILVATLREPPRAKPSRTEPLGGLVIREFSATVPPFTLWAVTHSGGLKSLGQNLAMLAPIAVVAGLLGRLTGDWFQWIAVGLACYSIASWGQVMRLRDRPLFELTFGCPIYVLALSGMSIIGTLNNTVQFWAAPYAIRVLHIPTSQVGALLGADVVVGSIIGMLLGGFATDFLRKRDERAPFIMALVALFLPIPITLTMFFTKDPQVFVVAYFFHAVASGAWGGAVAALAQDLVLPRMRGTSAAASSLTIIVISLAIGPYWSGKISGLTHSLSTGVLSLLCLVPVSVVLLVMGARRIRGQLGEARVARAALYGEV